MRSIYLLLLGLVIVTISELIGTRVLPVGTVSITILPMLYAVILGFCVAPDLLGKFIKPLHNLFDKPIIKFAGQLAGYALLILGVRLGFSIGPNVTKIFTVGPAFIAQELGHFFSPVIAMPLALALGMKREAVGATASIARESAVGIITERYGINSPEGRGVLGVYIIGSILGTIVFSVIGSVAIYSGLHPYALAMACGVGSASMMTAAVSALITSVPVEMQELVLTYAGTSNLLSTGVTSVYLLLWGSLPFTNWYYDKLSPFFSKKSGE